MSQSIETLGDVSANEGDVLLVAHICHSDGTVKESSTNAVDGLPLRNECLSTSDTTTAENQSGTSCQQAISPLGAGDDEGSLLVSAVASNLLERDEPVAESCTSLPAPRMTSAEAWAAVRRRLEHAPRMTSTQAHVTALDKRNPQELNVASAVDIEVDVTPSVGKTASLLQAIQKHDKDYAEALIGAGGTVDPEADDVRDAICMAVSVGELDTLQLLMRAKASFDNTEVPLPRGKIHPSSTPVSGDNKKSERRLVQKKVALDTMKEQGQTPLELACDRGSYSTVKKLHQEGVCISPADTWVTATLCQLAADKESEFFRLLLKMKAQSHMRTCVNGETPLLAAIRGGAENCVNVLRAYGVLLDPQDSTVQRIVCNTAAKGEFDKLRLLVRAKASVDVLDDLGRSPLELAIAGKHKEIVNYLKTRQGTSSRDKAGQSDLLTSTEDHIKATVECDTSNALVDQVKDCRLASICDGATTATSAVVLKPAVLTQLDSTSLFVAVIKGDTQAVQSLIDANVPINVTDDQGRTPLLLAIGENHPHVARVLLDAGADHSIVDQFHRTPLSIAAAWGHLDSLNMLIQAGAALNAVNNYNQTALFLACHNRQIAAAETLLAARADPDVCIPTVGTALSAASLRGHIDTMNMLLDAKADVGVTNNRGRTPLHFAARFGHADAAQVLIASGANVNAQDADGFTPMSLAAAHGRVGVVQVLREAGAHVSLATSERLP